MTELRRVKPDPSGGAASVTLTRLTVARAGPCQHSPAQSSTASAGPEIDRFDGITTHIPDPASEAALRGFAHEPVSEADALDAPGDE